ncbi:MAG: hypothetical protein ACI9TF_001286 [Paracrocinitomix sp.]|jgi:hypothetical protein
MTDASAIAVLGHPGTTTCVLYRRLYAPPACCTGGCTQEVVRTTCVLYRWSAVCGDQRTGSPCMMIELRLASGSDSPARSSSGLTRDTTRSA